MNRTGIFLAAALMAWAACAAAAETPAAKPAEAAPANAPPAPDYSQAQSWAAWPGRPNNTDQTPAGVKAGKADKRDKVDVFFIHPTTAIVMLAANARFDETGLTRNILNGAVMRFQASVFNGCCRIFMPRYRQASLLKIIGSDPVSLAATNLAYSDVQSAFDYYIKHENHGRPFILASHSQGSIHAIRLLQERIIGTPLMKQMVAAYVIGVALPAAIEKKGLPVCDSPTQTHCVVEWRSVKPGHDDKRGHKALIWWDGKYQPVGAQPIVCVNPLSWKKDGAARASENLGSVFSGGGLGGPMPAPVPHVTGARCNGGQLWVDVRPDQRSHFRDALSMFGSYHDYDYNLFYMNIRSNVEARIAAYFDPDSVPVEAPKAPEPGAPAPPAAPEKPQSTEGTI